jgi:hypothetical protein
VLPPPATECIVGRHGTPLADVWRQQLAHYRAVEVAGFPNYFRLAGIGCGIGHGSLVFMIESQTRYLVDVLRAMRTHGQTSVEVTERAQGDYMSFLTNDLDNTVWMKGGCQSWYQDENGQTASMWPQTMWSYRRLLTRFVPADHHLRAVSRAAVTESVA